DGVDRNVDGEGACDGVDRLGGIHKQHALTLPDALDVNLSVRSPHYTGYQRQCRPELLLDQGQGLQLSSAYRRGRSCRLWGSRLDLAADLYAFPDDALDRTDELDQRPLPRC